MDDQDLKSTSVMIAGRSYPLKIQSSDEAEIRDIVKEVNEKVMAFSTTYTKKDKQDCMAMVLLTYAVDLHKLQKEGNSGLAASEEVSESILNLEGLLDNLLRSK